MTRPQRIEYAGAFYHVMNRGRHRNKVFSKESHYHAFLDILSESVNRFSCEIHAYCLMSNHYHLLISTPNANLQRVMRHIGGVYTQLYNRDMGKDGSLFRGRYKAILVDHDSYLLHVGKYIHLNPQEAGMVDKLDKYAWSSYPAYVGKAKRPEWLNCDLTYTSLTESRQKRRAYRRYVEQVDLDDDIAAYYAKKRAIPIIGNESFRQTAAESNQSKNAEAPKYERRFVSPTLPRIVNEVAKHYGVTKRSIRESIRGRGKRNWPRPVAMYVGQQVGDYTLNELADYFGLNHYGSAATQVKKVREIMAADREERKQINSIIIRFDP